MALEGMDVDVIRSVSKDLKSEADKINDLINSIGKTIGKAESNWHGPDSKKFVGEWNSQYKGALKKLQSEIEDLSKTASKNADAQNSTSNAL